jgi:hypothetical protein
MLLAEIQKKALGARLRGHHGEYRTAIYAEPYLDDEEDVKE